MIRYLKAGMKRAFGLHRPGRKLPVRPDDILLASYPRSGSTWMRFLVANLLHPGQAVDFGNLHQLIVDPDVSLKREIDRMPRPRIIKMHASFDPRYRRVIYVVRDPRDVAISQYQHVRDLESTDNDLPTEEFISHFVAGDLNRHIGSWGENAGSWLATRAGHPGFLVVRYEDMVANTAHELNRVAEFVGCRASSEAISQAVVRSSADKMWEGEKKQGQSFLPVQPAKSRWQDELPKPLVARIEAAWGDIMTCLGYGLTTPAADAAQKRSLIKLLAAGAADATSESEKVLSGSLSGLESHTPRQTTIH